MPTELCEGLRGASADDLGEVTLLGGGEGLYWERLDADLGVAGLLAGRFGSEGWMARLRGTRPGVTPSPGDAAGGERK